MSRPGLYKTGRDFDVAVVGPGHFQLIDLETGTYRFTRRGRFNIDRTGILTLAEGAYRVEPAIHIPPDAQRVHIQPEGMVLVDLPGHEQRVTIGQVQLALFLPGDVELPPDLFGPDTPAAPMSVTPGLQGAGLLQQGWLEESEGPLERMLASRHLAWIAVVALLAALAWVGYELTLLRAAVDRSTGVNS